MQAKGLISEYQPKYNSAKAVYREMKKYIDEIDWNMLAVPPSGSSKATSCILNCSLLASIFGDLSISTQLTADTHTHTKSLKLVDWMCLSAQMSSLSKAMQVTYI